MADSLLPFAFAPSQAQGGGGDTVDQMQQQKAEQEQRQNQKAEIMNSILSPEAKSRRALPFAASIDFFGSHIYPWLARATGR